MGPWIVECLETEGLLYDLYILCIQHISRVLHVKRSSFHVTLSIYHFSVIFKYDLYHLYISKFDTLCSETL